MSTQHDRGTDPGQPTHRTSFGARVARTLLSWERAAVPWQDVGRATLSTSVPVVATIVAGHQQLVLFALLGSIPSAFGPAVPPVRAHIGQWLLAAAASFFGAALGLSTRGSPAAVALLVVVLLGMLLAMLSRWSRSWRADGFNLLVGYALASGVVGVVPAPLATAMFVLSALWAVVLRCLHGMNAGRSRQRYAHELVGDLVTAVGHWVRAGEAALPPHHTDEPPTDAHHEVMRRWDLAVAAIVEVDTDPTRSPVAARNLRGLLMAVRALMDAVPGMPRDSATRADVGEVLDTAARELSGDEVEVRRVQRMLTSLPYGNPEASGRPAPTDGAGSGEPTSRAAGSMRIRPGPGVDEVRYVLVLVVAELVRLTGLVGRSYWVLLTVALVVRPGPGAFPPRAVQRAIGTLVGVGLTGATEAVAQQHVVPIVVAMAVFSGLCPVGRDRNYWLFTAAMTPLVLLASAPSVGPGPEFLVERLAATGIGALVGVVVGYLVWPSTWSRRRLHVPLGRAVGELAAYLGDAFDTDLETGGVARRRARDALTAARVSIEAVLQESGPLSRAAQRALELVWQLEAVCDATEHAQVRVYEGEPAPPRATVAALRTWTTRLLSCDGTAPVETPSDPDGVLRDVAVSLAAAQRVASGLVKTGDR